jgi:dihydrodipicolinate synthase/N-acetylneuraminate lyase
MDRYRRRMTLHGTVAAVVTPLRDGGARLDEDAIGGLAAFVARGGCDGVLVAGTTGEGILLSAAERRALAEAWLEAAPADMDVAVHVGAQTTAEAVALAEHAAQAGAAAVAVIGPPYYAFTDAELEAHFAAVIAACAPTPAYLYEFRERTGYAVPPAVVERLRDAHPSLAGIKVSDRSFDEVRSYLLPGLDAFIGSEALIPQGMATGAVGAVSGLATAFPDLVAAVVADPTPEGGARLAEVRTALAAAPTMPGLKRVLQRRGVAISGDVRAPLQGLTAEQERAIDEAVERFAHGVLEEAGPRRFRPV